MVALAQGITPIRALTGRARRARSRTCCNCACTGNPAWPTIGPS